MTSLISSAMSTALGALATAAAQTLDYRLGTSGSWTSLAHAFLEQLDPQLVDYDENRRAVIAPARATLRVAAGQTRLVPGTVAKGCSMVRHTLGTSITEWSVVGAAHNDGLSVYELQRAVPQSAGDPRDGVPR